MADRHVFYRLPEDWEPQTCLVCGGTVRFDELALDSSKPSGRNGISRPCDRERARAYYAANREAVLERAAAKRGHASPRHCSECDAVLGGRKRVVCSSRCREARFRRLNPEAYAAREAAKVARRRARRRELKFLRPPIDALTARVIPEGAPKIAGTTGAD